MAGPVQLLRRPPFRQLYSVRVLSQAGDGVFETSLASFVVFSPQRAATAAGIAASLAVVLLPFCFVEPFTGIMIDRVRRQRVLLGANLTRVALALVLAALIVTNHAGVGFLLTALAIFSVTRFMLSALAASLPVVIGLGTDEHTRTLVVANSLSSTSGSMATLIGAGLGAGVRAIAGARDSGVAVVAVVAAAMYLASSLAALRIPVDGLGPTGALPRGKLRAELRRVVAEMSEGALTIARRQRARSALLALAAYRGCYGLSFVATILLYRNYFHGPGSGIGGLALLLAFGGVGTVGAALVTPRATRFVSKQAWLAMLIGLACGVEIVFGLPYRRTPLLFAALLIGFVAQGAKICVDTIVQEEIPDTHRGRAFSVYDLLFNGAYVAAAGVGAALLPNNGKSYVVLGLIAGGYGVTSALFTAASVRSRRRGDPSRYNRPGSGPALSAAVPGSGGR